MIWSKATKSNTLMNLLKKILLHIKVKDLDKQHLQNSIENLFKF